MAPGLDALLLANGAGEERAPLQTRIRLVDLRPSRIVKQLAKVWYMRMEARVIVGRRQLDQLADKGNGSIHTHILVSNDGLGGRLGLIGRGAKVLEDEERLDTSVNVKGHVGCREVLLGCAKVVEETGQSPGYRVKTREDIGELLLRDGHSCDGVSLGSAELEPS